MIQARLQINGEIKGREQITGNINGSIKNIYPELENIEINPTTEKQYLKSEKYGYNEITVNEVTSDIDKNIKSEHIKKGVTILGVNGGFLGIDTSDANASANDIRYNKTAYVDGEKIVGNLDEAAKISLNATKIEQIYGGNLGPTGIVEYSEKDIIIKKGTQISMSMPSSVLANVINVTSENLLVGNEVLGVQGTATSDATVTSDTIIEGEIAYAKGQKITGNIKNNGELNFVPSANLQQIPKGYTSGGIINPVDITTLEDYQVCEEIANNILGDYKEYIELEYIENTDNQYIDTGVEISNGYRIESKINIAQWYGPSTTKACYFAGFMSSSIYRDYTVLYEKKLMIGMESDVLSDVECLLDTWYNIDMSTISGNGYIKLEGETLMTSTNTVSHNKANIWLFGVNYDEAGKFWNAYIKMGATKIYDATNTLVRDFIPVRMEETGEIGMYDKLNKKFYPNKGSGEFVAGGVI